MVFTVLKLAGAAYLVWLGFEAVRRRKEFLSPTVPTARGTPMTWPRAVRQGYVVGASNPKGYMMLAAVLPQFVDRGEGHVQLQMLLLGLLATTIGMLSDSLWALIASPAAVVVQPLAEARRGDGHRRRCLDDRPGRRPRVSAVNACTHLSCQPTRAPRRSTPSRPWGRRSPARGHRGHRRSTARSSRCSRSTGDHARTARRPCSPQRWPSTA